MIGEHEPLILWEGMYGPSMKPTHCFLWEVMVAEERF